MKRQPDEGAFDLQPGQDVKEGPHPDNSQGRLVGFYLQPFEILVVDKLAQRLGYTRAAILRQALSRWLVDQGESPLEERRRLYYGSGRRPGIPRRLPGEMLVDYYTRTLGRFPTADDPPPPADDGDVVAFEQEALAAINRVSRAERRRPR